MGNLAQSTHITSGRSSLRFATSVIGVIALLSATTPAAFAAGPPVVSGDVQADTDGDGTADAGVGGIEVTLTAIDGTVVDTVQAAADGTYSFSDVPDGTYTVTVDVPAGFKLLAGSSSTASATVAGSDVADVDFGVVGTSDLTGSVTGDSTDDGTQDASLGNVTVNLKDSAGAILQTATTDASGNYRFNDVPVGSYTISTVPPSGYQSLGDSDGGATNSISVTVTHPTQPVPTAAEGTPEFDAELAAFTSAGCDVNYIPASDGTAAVNLTTFDEPFPLTEVVDGTTVTVSTNAGSTTSDTSSGLDLVVWKLNAANDKTFAFDFSPALTDPLSTTIYDVDGKKETVTVVAYDAAGAPMDLTGVVSIGANLQFASGTNNVVVPTQTFSPASFTTNPENQVGVSLPAGVSRLEILGRESLVGARNFGFENPSWGTPSDATPSQLGIFCPTMLTGHDFTNEPASVKPGTVSGTSTADTTGDNNGDTPLPGVTIKLIDPDGNTIATTTTDTNGNYTFTNITPGNYTITETDPTGYNSVNDTDGGTDNTIAITVQPDTTETASFINETKPGTVSGTSTADTTGDNNGDTPLPGVTIKLIDPDGNTIATTTTDTNGNYTITNITPGNYTITETDPTGYNSVNDTDGGTDNTIAITVQPDTTETASFINETKPGTVSGTSTADTTGDNNGDTPLPGVTIKLIDPDGNTIATTTTDTNGNYTFTNITPGNYTITETDPTGYNSVNDTDGGTDNTIAITVGITGSGPVASFVNEPASVKPGTVSGTSTADTTGDNNGDTPLPGVTIKLIDTDGNTIATTTTDTNGNYTFTNITPGNYTITETDPTGYNSVNDTDGGTDNTIAITVQPDTTETASFVNETKPGTVSGTSTADTTGDNNGDTPLPGVTIKLIDTDGNTIATTTTDTNGNYTFTNITPGNYTITETDPTGYNSVNDTDGGTDNTIAITVGITGSGPVASFVNDVTTSTGPSGARRPVGETNSQPGVLAFTGSSTRTLTLGGLLLTSLGALLIPIGRRGRRQVS